jgi:hypothetical protein
VNSLTYAVKLIHSSNTKKTIVYNLKQKEENEKKKEK